MEKKTFHVGDLVSVADGHLMGPNLFDGVYAVIDFVTGWPHMTHQLITDFEPVGEWLKQQHPFLRDLVAPDFGDDPDEARAIGERWLAELVAAHGEFHEVEQMPQEHRPWREPVGELRDMVGPDKPIIVVDAVGEAPK